MKKKQPKSNPLSQLIASAPATAPKTATPAAAKLVGDPKDIPATTRTRFGMWFYGPDRDAMAEAARTLALSGRKVNESNILRAILRLAETDERFLQVYDELQEQDPRRHQGSRAT